MNAMKKTFIVTIIGALLLCGCNTKTGDVEMSREEYEKLLEMAGDKTETSIEDSTSTEMPSPTAAPEEDGVANEFESVDISQIDFENGDWFVLDFKHPDVQLLAPSYVKDWPEQDFDIHTSTEHSAVYRNTKTITDGHLDGVLIRIKANYSDEPEPQYSKDMFSQPDSMGGVTLEWSFDDHLFRKHHRYNGTDSFTCYYTPEGYKFEIYIEAPTDEIENYRKDFLVMSEMLRNAPIDVEKPLTEEQIVERCRAYVDSPYAEVDHYNDDGSFSVHCYEIVEDGAETHTATWAWIVVDPDKKTAYDDLTMEPIEGIFE